MKKVILFILLVISILSFTSCFYEIEYFFENVFYFDDVHYKLARDGQSYYVSGSGFYHGGEVEIKNSYRGLPVTEIQSLRGKVPVKKVYIPENVSDLSHGAFDIFYETVEWIEVSPDNPTYKSIDGNLYSKDGKTLIRYAPGKQDKNFVTPQSVLYHNSNAFSDCDNLEEITFSDSVISIGTFPFIYCDNLRRINIGSGVKQLLGDDFMGCQSIDYISVSSRNPYLKSIDGDLYTKDGSMLIRYASGKTESEFTIPDTVTAIGSAAFENSISLQHINIPESVVAIETGAFRYCTGLKNIIIPDSVEGETCQWFKGCSSLETIVLGDSITALYDYEFSDCISLKSVTLPSSTTVINEGMFRNCEALEEVILPEKLEVIESSAFNFCISLKRLYIPENVREIAPSAFISCFSLEYIEVAENNEYFKSVDGNLYTKDGKELVKYAVAKQDKSFNVPQGVEIIWPCAFEGNNYLKTISIPDTVTDIGRSAFVHCTALESINIPKTVNEFGIDEMLLGCTSLERIDYDGTINEWHSMQYGYCGIHIQETTGFKIYCTDGVIEE